MSKKHNRTGRSNGEGRFVRLFHWMLKCPAWSHLGALERAIYLEMAGRYAGEGSNNGKLPYSVREAAGTFKVGKTTAARAIHALEETGFIVSMTKGGFNRKARHATEWRLTEFRCDVTGDMASKDFMRWCPSVPVAGPKMQNTVPVAGLTVPVAGQYGTCGGTMGDEKGPHGTCGGTVEAQFNPSSVPVAGHLYIYQGEAKQSEAPSHHHTKRGRSAPPKSAVASPRVPEIETPPVTASSLLNHGIAKATLQGKSRATRNLTGSGAAHLMETGLMKRTLLKGGVQ